LQGSSAFHKNVGAAIDDADAFALGVFAVLGMEYAIRYFGADSADGGLHIILWVALFSTLTGAGGGWIRDGVVFKFLGVFEFYWHRVEYVGFALVAGVAGYATLQSLKTFAAAFANCSASDLTQISTNMDSQVTATTSASTSLTDIVSMLLCSADHRMAFVYILIGATTAFLWAVRRKFDPQ